MSLLSALLLSTLLQTPSKSGTQMFAHYMPWYEAPPISKVYGWHWTMGKFDPSKDIAGGREIASRYMPRIGIYDSSDPKVQEFQALQMKVAGLEGAIIDWYGYENVYDYQSVHKNTLSFIKQLKKVGLKYAITLEDQVLPNLIKFGKVQESETVPYAKKMFDWMDTNFFKDDAYLKDGDTPILLVFGPQFYKAGDWKEILTGRKLKVYGVNGPHSFGNGGFNWPAPKEGLNYTQNFYNRGKGTSLIAGAFPRFHDIYEKAGVRPSYGEIPDDDGKTLMQTLDWAVASGAKWTQIATWNDWGEGTQIEPSVQHGNRDLKIVQGYRRKHDPSFRYREADLDLMTKIWALKGNKATLDRADQAMKALQEGRLTDANNLVEKGS